MDGRLCLRPFSQLAERAPSRFWRQRGWSADDRAPCNTMRRRGHYYDIYNGMQGLPPRDDVIQYSGSRRQADLR